MLLVWTRKGKFSSTLTIQVLADYDCLDVCPFGTYLREVGTARICEPCSDGCRSCIGPKSTDCLLCTSRSSKYIQYKNSRECLQECPIGFTTTSNQDLCTPTIDSAAAGADCHRTFTQADYSVTSYQRFIYFYPVSEFDVTEHFSALEILRGTANLCNPFFDSSTSIWGTNFKCYYAPTKNTLILSLDEKQPVLSAVPLSAIQKEEYCAIDTQQTEMPLKNSAFDLDVQIENLNTGNCECPVLSVLSSPGVAFQGNVQWSVAGVQSSTIDQANDILVQESAM